MQIFEKKEALTTIQLYRDVKVLRALEELDCRNRRDRYDCGDRIRFAKQNHKWVMDGHRNQFLKKEDHWMKKVKTENRGSGQTNHFLCSLCIFTPILTLWILWLSSAEKFPSKSKIRRTTENPSSFDQHIIDLTVLLQTGIIMKWANLELICIPAVSKVQCYPNKAIQHLAIPRFPNFFALSHSNLSTFL